MISPSLPEQVQLFKSVFKGRDDVFAIRWEKGDKSGYMPAHSFDSYFYRSHKAKDPLRKIRKILINSG